MLLELKHIVKKYDMPDAGSALTVLDGVTLSVDRGEAIAVTGPSGSGKSTLLNIVGALDVPTSGSVIYDGIDLSAMSDNERARFRNSEIGFVFQLHHLLPQCTVLENVLIPILAAKERSDTNSAVDRAKDLLTRVGLENHFEYYPTQLSGGERQRTAVVRALINSPGMLLADEPTGSLDRDSADSLGRLLMQLNEEEQVTLVVVTHSIRLAENMKTLYSLQNGSLAEKNQH